MSERAIADPTEHGWVDAGNGKWVWGVESGGSIQDGDTEGQITTWDGTEWTPDDAVVVSNGNVGIGVSSTPWLLHARSDSGPRIRVENTTDAQASFDLKTATRETRLITDSSSIVRVYDQASNSDKLNIDADGNVNITGKLFINGEEVTAGGGGSTYTAGNGITISGSEIKMSGSYSGTFTANTVVGSG